MKRKLGFTLIELLVVIAIIAILAAILFPVFLTAKGRAQQAACLQHIKEIGTAVYSYLGDWNSTYPMNRYRDPLMPKSGPMDGTRFNWKTSVFPYVRSRTDVWKCPGNPFKDYDDETGRSVTNVSTRKFPRSFALNGDFFNQLDNNYQCAKRVMSDIPKPTKLLFVVESRFDAPDLNSGMLYWDGNPYGHVQVDGKKYDSWSWMNVHTGGTSNFLFADCHAVTMKIARTMTPQTMWMPAGQTNQAYYNSLATKLAPECY